MDPELARRRTRIFLVHSIRVCLIAAIVLIVRARHIKVTSAASTTANALSIDQVRQFFPIGHVISAPDRQGIQRVTTVDGKAVGTVVQTSPGSDHILGFSGPTNVAIAFDSDDLIRGISIVRSGDTRDHVAQVLADDSFLSSFTGKTRDDIADDTTVDAVSGATLTSLAIQESIIFRLAGTTQSLRFPDPPTLDAVRTLFPNAASLQQDKDRPYVWHVYENQASSPDGRLLRCSPSADNIVGYQGPTDTLIGIGSDDTIIGVAVGASYDNEPYVTYVREDEYFLTLFNGRTLQDTASLNLEAEQVEGVSGATMTSEAVARAVVVGADAYARTRSKPASKTWRIPMRDCGTAAVLVAGMTIGLTRLRGNRWARTALRLTVVLYLGLMNGDMVSQAMLFAWAQHGVPWRTAIGLCLLTFAAVAIPLASGRNLYCSHLCPHGALQQLIKDRVRWKLSLPATTTRWLKLIPVLLLAWCILVAMIPLRFSLVDIEPFDAWIIHVAGWATLTVAIAGLFASLFVPMAYCRFGCPTGALLSYLRWHGRSDRWSARDWAATGMFGLALILLAY